ncbi:hypothetical protein ADIWIN_3067 [Winogradskyella psychrotolerans RS-3]|uniref:Uncharacterized protein n=1 Tax=Winogradskyella psychrotolerans RS-3 TaxID=641526 RepID=S7WYJ7_9FLAO|nr:hypothetical protein [Winogradskyella psychrotolerans]EPR71869.1 hypothetical protein ADIWIN_3067 [Winogradskyella psychrotolerans RS-3]
MNIIQRIRNLFSSKNSLEAKIETLISQNNKLLKENNLPSEKLITDFEIKNSNTSIKFEGITDSEMIKNLPEIYLNKESQETISGTLSNITGGLANVGITSTATYGLFQATANPATLMQLSSGGVGSAVVNGGQITQQAGFVQAGTTMFTPMIIFQVASVITGQYYMNNISKQLNSIQEKLDELLNLFHIERQAKLVKSFQFISEILNKQNFVIEDFVLLKMILSELTDIREEYFLMVQNSVANIKNNNLYSALNSLSEAKKIAQEFEKTGFIFKMKTSLIADELYHLTKMAEFHMNICYKNPDSNRISHLSKKIEEISKFDIKELSFNRTNNLYKEMKEDTLGSIKYSEKESWFNESEIKLIRINIENGFKEFEKVKSEKFMSINKSYKNLILPFNEDKKIIIDNREGKGKLYIE